MQLFSLAVFGGLAAVASAQRVKIMLLGDSITEISCWRPLVWNQFTTAGLASSVDLVGTMNNLQSRCSRPAGFDPDHEGHSGWQAYDIARNNIAGWVQNTRPDIVQFMLGTNDIGIGGRSTAAIVDSYTMILNAIRAANPRAKVIIDKLIPYSFGQASVDALNNAITTWAAQQNTAASPVVIADCSRQNGYNSAWNDDGIHPNLQGDQFIASQVGPLLIRFIRDVQNGGGTPPGTTVPPTTTTTPSPPVPTGNCAALWGQCGGQGWNGPTCCSQGTCRFSNAWYSQCLN